MITSNIDEVLAGMKARQDKVDELVERTAKQCGVIAKSTTDPITPYRHGTLQGSVQPEVSQIGLGIWQLWFGTHGAFSKDGYNYAIIQEFWTGFLATGWFLSKDQFQERWSTNMAELKNG